MKENTFKKSVLSQDRAALVYYTTLPDGEDISTEFKQFTKLARQLKGALSVGVMRIDAKAPDFADVKKKFKLTSLDKNKPELRYYPNR